MLKHKILSSFVIGSLLLFSGCGKEGHLIDSAIGNVKYTVDSKDYTADYTDTEGTFIYDKEIKYISFFNGRIIYKKNKTITFTIGNLIIAKDFDLSKINDDGRILPADIVGVDRNNTTDKKIIKLIRVLQSLDSDNNASNGIFIDDNTKGYLGTELNIIDENISTLKTMVEDAGKVFISQRKAREHYIQKLRDMGIKPILSPFVTVWKTNSADESITIYIDDDYSADYNYTVDWGDGEVQKNINNSATHTYSNEGNHTVKISGVFPAIKVVSINKKVTLNQEASKLQKITQWGDIAWSSFNYAFFMCFNLDVNATDTPNLSNVNSTERMFRGTSTLIGNRYFNDWDVSNVTNMSGMFSEAEAFNQPLNNWDVSSVTDMRYMFSGTKAFNQPLNNWNVSNATNMEYVFYGAKAFNQPLNNWNVSSVTDMSWMFHKVKSFNQPLNNWNVSSVTSMCGMFSDVYAFNQPLNNWDVGSVTDMNGMFSGTKAFNQPLNNWDVSNVTDMRYMFSGTKTFNQPLNNWNVSNATNMEYMFYDAKAFNQPLNNWNVSSVTDMNLMFCVAKAFNQPLNNWNVSSVTSMSGMFSDAYAFNQPLNNWDVSNVTNMSWMFLDTKTFNQPLNDWDVSNVTNMDGMFYGAGVFNQALNNWNVSNVTNMSWMFEATKVFNQPLNKWDVNNVTDVDRMFANARAFTNQDLSSWNVSKVTYYSDFMLNSGSGNTQPKWK